MKSLTKITILLLLSLVTFACTDSLFPDKEPNTPTNNFDFLWHKVNEQYSFFDIKGVDWQDVYNTYRPMIDDGISDDSLFNIMAAMLNTLNDGHVNLISPFNVSRADSIFERMYKRSNINRDVVMAYYLGTNMITTGGLYHQSLHDGKIGYIYFPSFSSTISDRDIDIILDYHKDAKGIIIDIRQNGGGYISNLWTLLNHFVCDGGALYYSQIKNGPAHDDFSDLRVVYRKSSQKYSPISKPVVILTDRGTYSAASFFALCMMSYDNAILVGDTTGGGLGLPNGGQLPNGWTYRFSITRTLSLEGQNYENGIPPHHSIILNKQNTLQGIDNVIDFACQIILNK